MCTQWRRLLRLALTDLRASASAIFRRVASCTRPRVSGRPPPSVSARRGWNLLVSASRFDRSRLTLIESRMLQRAPSNVNSVSVKFCKLYIDGKFRIASRIYFVVLITSLNKITALLINLTPALVFSLTLPISPRCSSVSVVP